jgi:hypothetical protein
MSKNKPLVFAPASEKQKLVLMDNQTDVLLVGGGDNAPPYSLI